MSKKIRVDQLMFERGLAESRSQAQRLVMAGQVRAAGQVVPKPSTRVASDVELIIDRGPRFVSRGGEKLAVALDIFDLRVDGAICADVGASTGGFTDCLLQNGAAKVYAIDVGKGILHWKLRKDPRVIVMEGINARYIDRLPEPVSLVTIDASFISLKILLPVVRNWYPSLAPLENRAMKTEKSKFHGLNIDISKARGEALVLIKPQFEAGRKEVARGKGVIQDPAIHNRVLMEVLSYAEGEGYFPKGLVRSPVLGPKGNVEFLAWLGMVGEVPDSENRIQELVSAVGETN